MMPKEFPQQQTDSVNELFHQHELVLYNDDVNTFEFVIQTLIDVCEHDRLQAEQCALITHHNGKCSVKQGTWDDLKDKKQVMTDLGLSVEIT